MTTSRKNFCNLIGPCCVTWFLRQSLYEYTNDFMWNLETIVIISFTLYLKLLLYTLSRTTVWTFWAFSLLTQFPGTFQASVTGWRVITSPRPVLISSTSISASAPWGPLTPIAGHWCVKKKFSHFFVITSYMKTLGSNKKELFKGSCFSTFESTIAFE